MTALAPHRWPFGLFLDPLKGAAIERCTRCGATNIDGDDDCYPLAVNRLALAEAVVRDLARALEQCEWGCPLCGEQVEQDGERKEKIVHGAGCPISTVLAWREEGRS
ncbi:MAG: hypothetical protein QME96_15215 [Myxococcota bacterium]|nr:hypothetical protein [Myxococcota bacterium]